MPTRIQNEASGGLISYFYTDSITGKPITVAKTETQVINAQSCVMLKEIPYRFTRVRITNRTMYEVDNSDEVIDSTKYYVNYNSGMVYFYPSLGQATITFAYDSIGYVYTTSTRIATQWDGTTVIETLQDMMNTMNHAILVSTTYATADDLIKDIEARTLVCNNSITSKISDANTAISNIGTTADNKIADVNTAITNANTAKSNLETAIANAQLSNYQMKSDNTLTTTAKTIVGGINEIVSELPTTYQTKTDNTLETTAKTLVGAINELKELTIPVKSFVGETAITLHCDAGQMTAGINVEHGLGYKPSRVEAYVHGGDANGQHNELDYTYVPSYIYMSHTEPIDYGLYTITQVGVSSLDVNVFIKRYSAEINLPRDYVVDVYLYK